MKTILNVLLLSLLLGSFNLIYSQNKIPCKVIHEDDSGTYKGKCKKGFAHGNGIYKFSDGEKVYEGRFKKGMFSGNGEIYKITNGEKEVLKSGTWKNNKYLGKNKVISYTVKRSENVDRYTIRKVSEGNRVEINFFQNGTRNQVRALNINANSGVEIVGSYIGGFHGVEFPFVCEVNYTTQNKFKTITYQVNFDFIITEPGAWDVTLFN